MASNLVTQTVFDAMAQSQRAWQRVADEIDLPLATAVWVLMAHFVTIIAPIVSLVVIAREWHFVADQLVYPWLLVVSAACFIMGSVFETAQNTQDRWYLTGTPPAFCDLMFNSLIVLGIGCNTLACFGDNPWVLVGVSLCVVLYPVAYLLEWSVGILLNILGLSSAFSLYWAFKDPVVFLQLLTVFLTLYFLDILLKTRAQAMHGFTTIVHAFGAMTLPWAIYNASLGSTDNWLLVVIIAVTTVALALILRPRLLRLPPTPRRAS